MRKTIFAALLVVGLLAVMAPVLAQILNCSRRAGCFRNLFFGNLFVETVVREGANLYDTARAINPHNLFWGYETTELGKNRRRVIGLVELVRGGF